MSLTKVSFSMIDGAVASAIDFGADASGVSDSTAAIQAAIDSLAPNGGVVYLAPGSYLTTGQIIVKPGVVLSGPPGNPSLQGAPNSCPTIKITGGAGSSSNPSSFLMRPGSGLQNLHFSYPNQVAATAVSPTQYPWLIDTTPDNPGDPNTDDVILRNLFLGNPYLGINLVRAGRFMLENISGQPLARGVYANNVLDVCSMRNIHWWTYIYASGTNMDAYIRANLISYQFGRVDGLEAWKLSSVAANQGLVFQDDGQGACWGTFEACEMDVCLLPVYINQVNKVTIVGGSFNNTNVNRFAIETSSDIGAYGSGVGANATISFVGSTFRGQPVAVAYIPSSQGTVKFVGCDFPQGASGFDGWRWAPLIVEGAANVIVSGCQPDVTPYMIGAANVVVDGIPMVPLSTDVTSSLSNFNMATWGGGVPTGWNVQPASPGIAQITGGIEFTIPASSVNYKVSYPIPAWLKEQKDLWVLEFDYSTTAVGNSFLFNVILWKTNFSNICFTGGSSVYGLPLYSSSKTVKIRIPLYLGQFNDNAYLSFYLQGNGASGVCKVTNIKLYNAAISSLTNEQIDKIVKAGYGDHYGYGIATQRRGMNKELLAPAVPVDASSTFAVGDRVINIPPVAGQPKAWSCTVAGSPGTWVSEGNL